MGRRGCIYKRKGRDGWSARVLIGGSSRYRGAFGTRAMAEAWIAGELRKEREAEVLGIEAIREDKTFTAFLREWKASLRTRLRASTVEGYLMVADRVLVPYFGAKPLAGITPEDIRMFERHRHAIGVSSATLNRYRTVLSSIFARAIELNFMRTNPLAGLKRGREAVRAMEYLGREEELRLFAAMPPWLRLPALVSLDAGLREGEVLALDVRDVDLGRRPPVVIVRASKTYRPREVGLTGRLAQALAEHVAALPKGGEPVFLEGDGATRLRKSTLWNAFRAARRRAKLPTFRFHDLRHMYGTRLAEAGATPAQIKAALGHKSLAATLRYIDHAPAGASRTAGALLDRASRSKGEGMERLVGS